MFTILLHSSKTMRNTDDLLSYGTQQPAFVDTAAHLATYLQSLDVSIIQKAMAISASKAGEVYSLVQRFDNKAATLPALDAFLGDIYSGLQAQLFTLEDRQYANNNSLYILSGLYGVLRPLDEIQPYRLEMGYKFPDLNLYTFWGDKIAKQLPKNQNIINLSAVEYTKAIFPYFKNIDSLSTVKIITPKFLTISPKTGEPTFVTVHAKIARGAYARWLIQNRIETTSRLKEFNEIGYAYNEALSTSDQLVFVAREFQGLGLSVRLT